MSMGKLTPAALFVVDVFTRSTCQSQRRLFLGAVQESDAAEGNELSFDSKKDIADCFLRLADLPTSALDRLSR